MTADELPARIMGSPEEAAAILGVGAQTVRRAIRDGTFPPTVSTRRFGRRIVINLHQLTEWCNQPADATTAS